MKATSITKIIRVRGHLLKMEPLLNDDFYLKYSERNVV